MFRKRFVYTSLAYKAHLCEETKFLCYGTVVNCYHAEIIREKKNALTNMPVKLAIIPSVLATTQKVSKPSTSLACVDTVTFWPLKFYIFFHFYL